MIAAALRRRVWQRAKSRCEYCLLHQQDDPLFSLHLEHIVARQHGGRSVASNLAISCQRCNLSKGPNLSGLDKDTGKLTKLFHPRLHNWKYHFRWQGTELVGRTPIGRATVHVLNVNASPRLMLRGLLAELKRFPPK